MNEIKLDPKNARLHNETNKEQIKKSLKDLGAGRSIVIDNEDFVVAGNGVYEQAKGLGIKTRIIETDGTELVVIKRTDLNYDDEKRRSLAIADNVASETSEWDFEELTEGEIEEWGIETGGVELDSDDFDTGFDLPEGDKEPFQQQTYTLADTQAIEIKNAIADIKKTDEYKYMETYGNENSNGNALYLIVTQWAEQKK